MLEQKCLPSFGEYVDDRDRDENDLENSMTSRRVCICAGLARRPLVVSLRDQLQHVFYTVNLVEMAMRMMEKQLWEWMMCKERRRPQYQQQQQQQSQWRW